uniref:Immunoglobulin V-set domain-containing protein n=1 Tax=Neogobius melanostomus TaxID=47308 RepID=A0A8C6WN74_9GOBI
YNFWHLLLILLFFRYHDLILPYETRPPCDVSMKPVEWRRNSKIVHARRKGVEDTDDKDPAFKDRTKTFPDDMGNGNLSLKISNVTKKDEGIYTVNLHKTLPLTGTAKCNVTVTIGKNVEHVLF